MSTRCVDVLLLGAGAMARRHAAAFGLVDGARVAGAVTRSAARAEDFTRDTGLPCFTQVDEAIARLSPHALVVCTPTEHHRQGLDIAINNNLHCLVEKPLAPDSREAAVMVEMARQHPELCLMTGHTEAFTPGVVALAKEIRDLPLRAVCVLKAGDGGLPPDSPPPESFSPGQRRGRMLDLLVHAVSQVTALLPAPVLSRLEEGHRPCWQVGSFDDTPGRERLLACCRLDDIRLRVSIDNRGTDRLTKEVAVETETGSYFWQLHDGKETLARHDPQQEARSRRQQTPLPYTGGDPFHRQAWAFVHAVRTRAGSPEPFCRAVTLLSMVEDILAQADRRRQRAEMLAGAFRQGDEALLAQAMGDVSATNANDLDAVIDIAPWSDIQSPPLESHAGRFAALTAAVAGQTTIRPYILRFLWEHSRQVRDPVFMPEARLALLYSGGFSPQEVLRLDTRCNQGCLFCNVGGEAHRDLHLSTDEARRLIDEWVSRGVLRLTISGGEPTLRPDLVTVVRRARAAGMQQVDLQTNAVALCEGPIAYLLAEAGLDGALVSLHSHVEKVSDYLTRAPGTWRRTMWGIRRLHEAGVAVRLVCVITSANMGLLPAYVRYVATVFPAITDLDLLLDQHTGRGLGHGFLVPRLTDLKPLLHQALEEAMQRRIRVNNALTIPPCIMGPFAHQTLEYQRLRAAALFHLPPEPSQAILAREKVKGPRCGDCVFDPYCMGVWKGYAALHGLEELTPKK